MPGGKRIKVGKGGGGISLFPVSVSLFLSCLGVGGVLSRDDPLYLLSFSIISDGF